MRHYNVFNNFRNCEAEGRGNPVCAVWCSGLLHTLCSQFRVFYSFPKLRGRRPRQSSLCSLMQWTASHFVLAVSSFFISHAYRNRERSDAIHQTISENAESADRPDNGLLHTSCSQFQVFYSFPKLRGRRPRQSSLAVWCSRLLHTSCSQFRVFYFCIKQKIKAEESPPLS